MRIFEIADAEAQLALWKLVNDSVWTAIQTQQHSNRKNLNVANVLASVISLRQHPYPKYQSLCLSQQHPISPLLTNPNSQHKNTPPPQTLISTLSHTHKLKQPTHPNHYQQQALPPPQMPAAQPITQLRKSTLYNSNVSSHCHHKMRYRRKRSVFYPINVRK